jgi:uncharacterized membrane protein
MVFSGTRRVAGSSAPQEAILSGHKYSIGQLVEYLGRERASGVYQITQLLPPEGGAFQYRIKSNRLLWIVLRRVADVLVTLIPLIVAGLVTLEICALTNFQLNYANIIVLPVLLGVGVAFKIYYVTAWRRGESNFLESVLTRAVFYSTLLTATAFGSLWVSNQPGISSMGKLLALSLVCTLTSAALFQPALMGEPRRQNSSAENGKQSTGRTTNA